MHLLSVAMYTEQAYTTNSDFYWLDLCWQTIWRQVEEKESNMTEPENKFLNFLTL